jgi:histidinol-phosphatase (PHP family)
VDYGIKLDWHTKGEVKYVEGKPLLNVDYPLYSKQIKELKEKYKNDIRLKQGLEFGVQTHTMDQFHKLFLTYPFDFIILSIHQVEDLEFWTQDFQKGRTQKEYNERYYQEMYDVITKFHDYSVIGHLDLIKRYDKEGIYPFENNKEIITDILTYIIHDGKGIEVNTSSFRYGLKDLMPSMEILKLYHHLGGNIITIGSDSHKEEHLGVYINYVKKQLKKIGFTHFCTFDKMKPVFHEIG